MEWMQHVLNETSFMSKKSFFKIWATCGIFQSYHGNLEKYLDNELRHDNITVCLFIQQE